MNNNPNPTLSIIIPTYNRAKHLEKQIKWAVTEAENFWGEVELLVLDNCSTDDTPNVCSRWKESPGINISIIRNDTNIGIVANCLKGIGISNMDFVWIVGDDEPIENGLLSKILILLRTHRKSLNLLHLNQRCTDGYEGEVIIESFYSQKEDLYYDKKGYELVNTLLKDTHTGGLMFISANILNRQKALDIINSSSKKEKAMLAYPMYLNTKLACSGGFYYFSEIKLNCVYHESSWIKEYNEIQIFQLPILWLKLKEDGLDKQRIILWLKDNIPEKKISFIRVLKDSIKHGIVKAYRIHKFELRLLSLKLRIKLWKAFQ